MREFTPDRPDFTESPITVDAGHLQLEMSFVDFTRNIISGARTDVTVFGSFNLKLGLLNNMDLEFVLDPTLSSASKRRARGIPRFAASAMRLSA